MSAPSETIPEKLARLDNNLTRAERQLSQFLLGNFPFSGLGSITKVAQDANVSTPTVVRMVKKLGFSGFPDFQQRLREELEAIVSTPIAKHDNWTSAAPQEHILNRFTDAVFDNIRSTLDQIKLEDFEQFCTLLGDKSRKVHIVGGRITRTLADYLFLHLQVMRRDVIFIPSNANTWPHYLLDVEKDDVLVVFDVRRYENTTLKLAETAAAKGAKILLFTDQWRSPIHAHSDCTICARIEAPSAWDSNVTLLLLLETLLAELQQRDWDGSRQRMANLEEMFDRTRFFRKFQ
ncbi:MurR/RpiR family transcriptional regulator [Rhodobacteraceae bacterium D3-12]|nr:MurR/RpiR family transcriptional regulator [Rhodobacteraceae bacterium D3-12]